MFEWIAKKMRAMAYDEGALMRTCVPAKVSRSRLSGYQAILNPYRFDDDLRAAWRKGFLKG